MSRARLSSVWRRFGFMSLSVALVLSGALLHASCESVTAKSSAAPKQRPEDLADVLAKIDDTTITVGDFQDRINKQSPYVRARYTSLERKKEFLDNLVRFEVLASEAKKKGLENDPEVVRTMKQVMIQKLMKDEFDSRVKMEDISDAQCQQYYDAHPEEYNKPEEVRVALVLVKDEKTAKKVLADPRIGKNGGLDTAEFRALVAEYSIDQATRERGGDLRYFDAGTKELPAEIVKASFALVNLGDVSPPVKTAQGWNIVKLTGRRKALTHPFDEVKLQIRNKLFRDKREQAMNDYIKELREKAKVEVHEDRLAKVVIEGAAPGEFGGPGVASPAAGMFHPNGQAAPQASPVMPGAPPAAAGITVPGPKPAPAAPATAGTK